jgi:hypothetical protein
MSRSFTAATCDGELRVPLLTPDADTVPVLTAREDGIRDEDTETDPGQRCRDGVVEHTGSNSLDELALHVAVKGFGFQVLHPPELIPVLRALSGRLRDAAAAS